MKSMKWRIYYIHVYINLPKLTSQNVYHRMKNYTMQATGLYNIQSWRQVTQQPPIKMATSIQRTLLTQYHLGLLVSFWVSRILGLGLLIIYIMIFLTAVTQLKVIPVK